MSVVQGEEQKSKRGQMGTTLDFPCKEEMIFNSGKNELSLLVSLGGDVEPEST